MREKKKYCLYYNDCILGEDCDKALTLSVKSKFACFGITPAIMHYKPDCFEKK